MGSITVRPWPRRPRVVSRSGTILLVAVWIGLIAGFIDVGLLVLKRKWIERDFFRTGGHFPWLIPLAVTTLVFVPAIVLALIGRLRGRASGWAWPWGFFPWSACST